MTARLGLSAGWSSYNWPDTGPGARLRKQADVWRVSLVDEASGPLEPRDKLDTREVNGPEGIGLNVDDARWRGCGIGRVCLSRVLG